MEKVYKILRIDEQDFGCEGRPDGAEPMVDVTLQAPDGTKQIFEEKDALLYERNINEKDNVIIEDGHLSKRI